MIPYPNPIPERITQGVPLTSYQHDQIHKNPNEVIIAIIDYLNTLGPGAGIPIGASVKWWTDTLPSNYIWENGSVLSKTVYPSLWALWGTTFNTGGEGPDEFRGPSSVGRYNIGTNPMGGVTDGTLPGRVLGVKFGAATVNFTPSGSIVVNVTNGAMSGSLNVTNGALLGNITNNLTTNVSVTAGTLASNVSVGNGTLASNVSLVNNPLTGNISITNNPITGSGTISVDGITCVPVPEGAGANQAIDCSAGLEVSAVSIAAALESNVIGDKNDLASDVDAVNNSLTGSLDVTNGALSGSPAVTNGALSGSITSNLTSNVSVGLGTLASDVSATAEFTGDAGTITLAPPTIACNWIIRYQ